MKKQVQRKPRRIVRPKIKNDDDEINEVEDALVEAIDNENKETLKDQTDLTVAPREFVETVVDTDTDTDTGTVEDPVITKENEANETDSWMNQFQVIKSAKGRSGRGSGALSIVNNANSKRVKFSDDILEPLEFPNEILLLRNPEEQELLITRSVHGMDSQVLKGKGKKNLIYSNELVEELTELFMLDFTNCTSRTLGVSKVLLKGNKQVVSIKNVSQED